MNAPLFFKRVLPIAALICSFWLIVPAPGDAVAPAAGLLGSAAPAFLPATGGVSAFLAPAAPPPARLGLPNSAIPPGGPAGQRCSVSAPQRCSTNADVRVCSAENDEGQACSIFSNPDGTVGGGCSAFGRSGACSVLPGNAPTGEASVCSTIGDPLPDQDFSCSAFSDNGLGRQVCSTKGAGNSICSVIQDPCVCSVLNVGASESAYCSIKTGQPVPDAKRCSAFAAPIGPQEGRCSILPGARGACTTFGQAPAGSCSIHVHSECSVIGTGIPQDPCVQ